MTALVIYKQGYMNVQEIANVMDLFYKFTMKVELEDGTYKEEDDVLLLSEMGLVERLVQGMRYINKVISPAFIRDWCLKCCRHLKSTAHLFKLPEIVKEGN